MKIKTGKFVKLIGAPWVFALTLLLFIGESGWLALTSRFPMAFDEAYHFGLIQFFAHRINPIVSSQTSSSYKFGAIVQDPSFLYHYLMSFPYRFIELFTKSLEVQAISLRFINVALAALTLIVLRKLLKLMKISSPMANVLLLVLAMTPLFTVLSAQINYDNLLILASSLSVYEFIYFIKELGRDIFNMQSLLTLLCLCLFTSLVMYSFMPIFLSIAVIIIWRVAILWRKSSTRLLADIKKSFISIRKTIKIVLLVTALVGSLLFTRFYIVNLIEYHNPVPQCNQVLNVADCSQYYAWYSNYVLKVNAKTIPALSPSRLIRFDAYWWTINVFDIYGAVMPLHGLYYVPEFFATIVILLGAAAFICILVNYKKVFKNKELLYLGGICFIYMLFLWARNFHDFLQLGDPVAISGRYLVPILMYVYILLATGLKYSLDVLGKIAKPIKLGLAIILVLLFVSLGGFNQYNVHITPVYGRISPNNLFLL